MIDFIGDIHGHADELEELLQKLGYTKSEDGVYAHPTRKVLFVGDYIDRGPKIRETLNIVRKMADNGSAIALMGNHEYNAICFHMENKKEGGHLRKHLIKNIHQHYQTLQQFQNRQIEYDDFIDWFKTLPLFYETDKFRAVHACWDEEKINFLKKHLKDNRLTDELIYQSVNKETDLYYAIDETLKGKECKLPEGIIFLDKDGNERKEVRIRWWENPEGKTYRAYSVSRDEVIPEMPVSEESSKGSAYYEEEEKPVFFGHYWLKGQPLLMRNNICCLDYSVAAEEKDGGRLAAYRFDGESILDQDKFVYVERVKKD